MKKTGFLVLTLVALVLGSCGSKKELASLKEQNTKLEGDLSTARMELAKCLDDKTKLSEDSAYLRTQSNKLLNSMSDMVILNRKEAENLERSLEAIKEKDMQIKRMSQAKSAKDSVTLALVTSLKGALGDMDDEDVQINVEKGVVLVSISDKMLFKSGSYEISSQAQSVLAKVAKVINARPGMDVLVEGHTDDKQVVSNHPVLKDNWDLSAYRATSVVRALQEKHGVAPERMIAGGRSFYIPVANNSTADGRSKNRRTRIIIMPKIDEFYGLIEEGMDKAAK
jgi:chemotaxis protein MotB